MLEIVLWVLGWLLLFALAGYVLFRLARSIWRKTAVLLRELSVAAERFAQVSEQLQELAEASAEPAVFDSPTRLRQQRFLTGRRSARARPSRRPR